MDKTYAPDFVNIVDVVGSGGTKPLSTLTEEEKKEKLRQLQKFLAPQRDRVTYPVYHPTDWQEILKLVTRNVLYVFAPLSQSADEVYFTETKNSLHWQFKNVEEHLTAQTILKEVKKVAALAVQDPTKNYTLVIVPLAFNQSKLEDAIPSYEEVQDAHNVTVSVRLPPGAPFNIPKQEKWNIPSNMDAIVLTQAGVKLLLTEYIFALLKNGSKNIEDYFRVLPE